MVWSGSVDVCWENVVCFDSIFNRPLYAELSTFDEENVIKKFLSSICWCASHFNVQWNNKCNGDDSDASVGQSNCDKGMARNGLSQVQ